MESSSDANVVRRTRAWRASRWSGVEEHVADNIAWYGGAKCFASRIQFAYLNETFPHLGPAQYLHSHLPYRPLCVFVVGPRVMRRRIIYFQHADVLVINIARPTRRQTCNRREIVGNGCLILSLDL